MVNDKGYDVQFRCMGKEIEEQFVTLQEEDPRELIVEHNYPLK